MKKHILTLFLLGTPIFIFAQSGVASQSVSNHTRTLKLPYDSNIREGQDDVSLEEENSRMAATDSTGNTGVGKKEHRRRKTLMAERSGSSSRSKASAK